MTRKQKGFTLIELLIVVAIIGILAAIAIPNLLTAMQRSKQKRTMADIRTIATAWEARATDVNKYNAAGFTMPGIAVPVSTLSANLSPTYVKQLPQKDGWNNAWTFATDKAFGNTVAAQVYAIASGGKDGSVVSATGTVAAGATSDFNSDIVYSNGSFIAFPDGVQK
jgi:type II secretion system protein G